jgi:sugar/nucleoside kinase (ribokinase family)
MPELAVIGNISIDHTHHPGRHLRLLGGAGLHTALAAHRAGIAAAPVAVIGEDLEHVRADPRLSGLDLGTVLTSSGPSCRFDLSYDHEGNLSGLTADYGVADGLTEHALARIAAGLSGAVHVCCRRPLDAGAVLAALTATDRRFSVDFFVSSAEEMIGSAAEFLPTARAVFANAAEYDLLIAAVPAHLLQAVIVTDGPRPAQLLRRGRLTAQARPPAAVPIEVTGAGDTLAGTFLAAWTAGAGDAEALRAAVAAASLHTTTQSLALEDR